MYRGYAYNVAVIIRVTVRVMVRVTVRVTVRVILGFGLGFGDRTSWPHRSPSGVLSSLPKRIRVLTSTAHNTCSSGTPYV